jgi:tetraacyldisaccharide 4'-kinase
VRAPSFWWRERGWAAALLAPVAALYGAIAAWRLRRSRYRVGVPVACVGGLTLGGAGKTPTALALGRLLAPAHPFFLTRGYGGTLAGPVIVDPARHDAGHVGDEALLLARVAPTVVARDRVAGAEAARAAGAGVIVMDDGFHSAALVNDLALLVLDAGHGVGNGQVFPAGPLRAPLAAQLAHAHAVLVIGNGSAAASLPLPSPGLTLFHGRLAPDAAAVASLAGRRLLAFAGIGHPDKFFATVEAVGRVAGRRSFPDHHRFTAADVASLLDEAARSDLVLVTTEKDAARMTCNGAAARLQARAHTLPVTLVLDEADSFRRFVMERLKL